MVSYGLNLLVVYIGLCLIPGLSQTEPLQCFKCDSVVEPDDCEVTAYCAKDEQCSAELRVSEENHRFYQLDCLPNTKCSLLEKYEETIGSTTTCFECCNNTNCNQKLCLNETIPRVQCYSCEEVSHPRLCDKTTECSYQEVCYLEGYEVNVNKTMYRLGCRHLSVCNLTDTAVEPHEINGGFERSVCRDCCTGEFCNQDLACQESHISTSIMSSTSISSPRPDTTIRCKQCNFSSDCSSVTPTTCPTDTSFCAEHVFDDVRTMQRSVSYSCATKDECYKWWSQSSQDFRCQQLPNQATGIERYCHFCCTTSGCTDTIPPAGETLFDGASYIHSD